MRVVSVELRQKGISGWDARLGGCSQGNDTFEARVWGGCVTVRGAATPCPPECDAGDREGGSAGRKGEEEAKSRVKSSCHNTAIMTLLLLFV